MAICGAVWPDGDVPNPVTDANPTTDYAADLNAAQDATSQDPAAQDAQLNANQNETQTAQVDDAPALTTDTISPEESTELPSYIRIISHNQASLVSANMKRERGGSGIWVDSNLFLLTLKTNTYDWDCNLLTIPLPAQRI